MIESLLERFSRAASARPLRLDLDGSISARTGEAQAFGASHSRRYRIPSLFARLTGGPKRGQALFDSAVFEARQTHWFVEGAVPDTLEGRFCVLSTLIALLVVRLERAGEAGESHSVALSERFIEAMDAEIRQMGVGDPALGRQVRSLVGALATRIGRWRSTIEDEAGWSATVRRSLYRDEAPGREALAHSQARLRDLWRRVEQCDVEDVAAGRLG